MSEQSLCTHSRLLISSLQQAEHLRKLLQAQFTTAITINQQEQIPEDLMNLESRLPLRPLQKGGAA